MPTLVTRMGPPSSAPERREELGRLLRQAFPLSDSGSFTDVLDAIRLTTAENASHPVVLSADLKSAWVERGY